MSLLTDREIEAVRLEVVNRPTNWSDFDFARAIASAVIARLSARVSVVPVAETYTARYSGQPNGIGFVTVRPLPQLEQQKVMAGQKLFTLSQLQTAVAAARVQALAKAAEVCKSKQTPGTRSVAILNGAADAIRALIGGNHG